MPLGDPAAAWPLIAALAIAYLIGSIPFGLLLTRIAGYGDIRAIGSGNIGATNVLRTGNKGLAAATLLLDLGKGLAVVLLAQGIASQETIPAAIGVILGHLFPVWLGFKGGKGVATAGGVILALAWPVGLLALLTWLAVALLWRYSSLAALAAAVSAPLYAWLLTDQQRALVISGIAILVILRHRENIRRLVRGEESKIRLSRS
jgi:acyl phosphate:glycerol-3-phosphate acyltransferase